MTNNQPRIMLAAPASGSGKTTLTMGLLQVLATRGLRPSACKCGPDYIDPMFHREVLGVGGCNLDLFFTAPDVLRGLFAQAAAGSGISVLEGVMGYYDGIGDTALASSWQVATETETPVLLVIQPKGAFLSTAALVKGFAEFRRPSRIAGIVLNRCGRSYSDKLAPVLERETGLRVYGGLPDVPEASIDSRHLGLTTPDAVDSLREKIALLTDRIEEFLDVDGIIELAESAPKCSGSLPAIVPVPGAPVRIGVAWDNAFCFYYRENLDLLQAFGAEPVRFSPLRDGALPPDLAGLYLGGGYPELYAEELGENASMRESVARAVRSGMPTLAECGGFLYLQEWLDDADGVGHPMARAIPGRAANAGRLRRFGYAVMTAEVDTMLSDRGRELRAHEFHHWDSDNPGAAFTAAKPAGGSRWSCIHADRKLHAGFPHLYFWSDPEIARRFVSAAMEYRGKAMT